MRLRPDNPALAEARTVFPYRVIPVAEVKKVLCPASGNSKIGKGYFVIAKGKWRGVPIYTLTLEERATCPTDCSKWANCYGNNMRFARRISHHESHTLCQTIENELSDLMRMYQRVCIRLHVLGDFFSIEYVAFWHSMMVKHKGLLLFGFTHWKRETPIGTGLGGINEAFTERSWIRFSDQGGLMSANVEGEGIPCPEQTGKTKSCLTCGICWSTTEPVSFLEH
mgnify:FL=1